MTGTRVRLLAILLLFLTASAFSRGPAFYTTTNYVQVLKKITDVMVNDVTSPVAASRYYAYITLSANEVQAAFLPKQYSFSNQLHNFNGIHFSSSLLSKSNANLSVILTILKTGEKLLPSGYLLQLVSDSIIKYAAKKGISQNTILATLSLVDSSITQMLPYIKSDGFFKLSNMRRYTPTIGNAYWQPTQPAFMAPVEPHWNTMRTFLLDSAQQFKPTRPAIYDTAHTSNYYRQLKEVYDITNAADAKQRAVAMFWDCNPFAVQQIGHVQFGLKKISPGGHWVGITGIACNQKKIRLQQTVLAHALVSIALADGFIACWDEKYRSNRIRPETAINRLIDPRWKPLLQTPPFPEYVSGHSVASTAAAAILTNIFGNQFSFTDDTEVEFELPIRKFESFNAAAAEAAISRLYGGIHYRDAIDQGVWQGKKVAGFVMAKIAGAFKTVRINR